MSTRQQRMAQRALAFIESEIIAGRGFPRMTEVADVAGYTGPNRASSAEKMCRRMAEEGHLASYWSSGIRRYELPEPEKVVA
jgi:hypothetical protein